MQITFIGTGTSAGVPLIGCKCSVCNSPDPRDQRLRSSILVSHNNKNIVVDTGPDFRLQMLKYEVNELSAVLFTHEHRDHIAGLDDTRPYFFWTGSAMPLYCELAVEKAIRRDFYYAFNENPYPGSPKFDIRNIVPNERFEVEGISVVPLRVRHGKLDIVGFKFGNFAYITDANAFSKETWEEINGIDYLVLNALRLEPHHSHFNLEEALEVVEKSQAKNVYFTHISHQLGGHAEIEEQLPAHVKIAYDGLQLNI